MKFKQLIKLKLISIYALALLFFLGGTYVVVDVKYLDWKTRADTDLNIIASIVETYKEYYGHYPSSFTELYSDPDLKPFQSKLSSNNQYEFNLLNDGFLLRATGPRLFFLVDEKLQIQLTAMEAHTRFGKNAPRK